MKIVIRLLFCMLTLLLLSNCKKSNTPEENPPDDHEQDTVVYFNDFNFYSAIIDQGFDTDSNGFISKDEAEQVIYLNVTGLNIFDLKGIEAFVNLKTLICSGNELSHLDLSYNTALEILNCSSNNLTTLFVSNDSSFSFMEFFNESVRSESESFCE